LANQEFGFSAHNHGFFSKKITFIDKTFGILLSIRFLSTWFKTFIMKIKPRYYKLNQKFRLSKPMFFIASY